MRVFRGAEAGMVRWNVIDFRFGGKIYVVLDTNVDYNRLIEILSSNVVIDASMSLALIMVAIREWKNG